MSGRDGNMHEGAAPRFVAWKLLVCAWAVFGVGVLGVELGSGIAAIASGVTGRLGLEKQEIAPKQWRVVALEPWSPLRGAGVEPGDVLVADRAYDLEQRQPRPGEAIGLTVTHGDRARHVVVTAVAQPHRFTEWTAFYLLTGLIDLAALAFGATLALRLPGSRSGRALAIAFMAFALNVFPIHTPPDWPQRIERIVFHATLVLPWFAMFWFAVHYPDDSRPGGWRGRLRRAQAPLGVLAVVGATVTMLRGLGGEPRWYYEIYDTTVAVFAAAVLGAFWEGWRTETGVLRRRYGWLLGSFACAIVPSLVALLADTVGWVHAGWTFLLMALGELAMLCGLLYAVLRHRVIDFGVVVGRSLVVAATGLVLVGAFNLLQFVLHRVVHVQTPLASALLGAALAIATVLVLRRVRPRAERLVDRWLFRAALEREAALERFTADAARIDDPEALAAACVAAFDRYARGGGAAFYAVDEHGAEGALRIAASLRAAPATLARAHPLRAALAAHTSALRPAADIEGLELALPLLAHDPADAFVLIGAPPDGTPLADDEVQALRAAALRVGERWQAARIAALRRRLARLEAAAPVGAA